MRCLVRRHHQWVAVHNTNISSIINLHGNVIVYCEFYCFWAASQAFSQNHPALSQDLRHTGGGEFIHCKKLLKVLHHMGRTVTVIPSAATLRKFVQQAVDARKPPVIILAYPVEAVTKREGDRAVLHAPLSEACCLSMEYGGVQNWHNNHGRASLLNASKILSVFPNGHNTHIGLDKPTSCPYTSVARPIDHSYVLVYGKWGVSAHVWGIKPQFNNSGLWDAIVAKHTVVFVRCTKELPPGLSIDAAKWQAWVQDGKVMCLDTLPVPLPWDDLLAHAEFDGVGLAAHLTITHAGVVLPNAGCHTTRAARILKEPCRSTPCLPTQDTPGRFRCHARHSKEVQSVVQ